MENQKLPVTEGQGPGMMEARHQYLTCIAVLDVCVGSLLLSTINRDSSVNWYYTVHATHKQASCYTCLAFTSLWVSLFTSFIAQISENMG